MIIFITILNSLSLIGLLLLYRTEHRERLESEKMILREVKTNFDVYRIEHRNIDDVLKCGQYVLNKAKFNRERIDELTTRLDLQENCFKQFGAFISEMGGAMNVDPKRMDALKAFLYTPGYVKPKVTIKKITIKKNGEKSI